MAGLAYLRRWLDTSDIELLCIPTDHRSLAFLGQYMERNHRACRHLLLEGRAPGWRWGEVDDR